MVLPSDERIKATVLRVLNNFLRARVPGHVDLPELPEEMPEGFSWTEAAKELGIEGKRAHKSLRERYLNSLAPGLIWGNWQRHEDDLIYREKSKGKGWKAISALLKGRSALSIRDR
jgi:hypothetical protein